METIVHEEIVFIRVSDKGHPYNETNNLDEAILLLISDIALINPANFISEKIPMNLN